MSLITTSVVITEKIKLHSKKFSSEIYPKRVNFEPATGVGSEMLEIRFFKSGKYFFPVEQSVYSLKSEILHFQK